MFVQPQAYKSEIVATSTMQSFPIDAKDFLQSENRQALKKTSNKERNSKLNTLYYYSHKKLQILNPFSKQRLLYVLMRQTIKS